MQRRTFLTVPLIASVASLLAVESAAAPAGANRTRWRVRASEGFDAIAFLGPLSGTPLYLDFYAPDAAAFAPRLPEAIRADVARLWNDATKDGFGLLGPNLQVLFSANGNDATIATLLSALRSRQTAILPGYQASSYWSQDDWTWFDRAAPRIDAILSAMQRAGFAAFRRERIGGDLDQRIAEMGRALAGFDVISWQEKLTGRTFSPEIQIVMLQFSKP
ncbi:hypothetical protein, partial [Roseateles sp.]|uniref:hypothetical protein n=1 Tax=Roseateles sp. TaxID=1971397 RepID=UPI002F4142E5